MAMNFFAGLLLLLMPEENAFWAFAGIIDEYFAGYYTVDMIESQVDQLIFEELMRERFYQTDGNSLNVDSEVDSLPHLQEQSSQVVKMLALTGRVQSPRFENPSRKIGLLSFGLGWRDRNKGKPNAEESSESLHDNGSPRKESDNQETDR
ncbi:hypothetical protein JHK86_036367 [Glycine max]|nr:hypothetical protein JHK86_036367 [Glycine max]